MLKHLHVAEKIITYKIITTLNSHNHYTLT